jgi:uncharacterized glyoxalase superfamily protein PhnB
MSTQKGVPEGLRTITASLVVNDGMAAIDYYKRAFGAEQKFLMSAPNGKVAHAELKIGDSIIFLNDDWPQSTAKSPKTLGGTTGGIQIYVEDCDSWYERAISAGATSMCKPTDMFWGDRWSGVVDPFGHVWSISTRQENLSEQEIARRQGEFFKQMEQASTKK